ncbi:hypothetical protein FC701_09400 [Bacillus mycoides]|uniref:Uncharacterized protein n=1 Tax=Bacillus mycoides TaxID=1405 RepID=A0A4U3AEH6_BACMY|nr:hypothetical protein FC701_09400 [Bacillus mycoides]
MKVWMYSGLSFFSRYLPGSKTPTSKFSGNKEVRWGMNTLPLIKVSLYIETSNSFTYTAVPAISICNFSFSTSFVT